MNKNNLHKIIVLFMVTFFVNISYAKPNILVSITPIGSLTAMLVKEHANVIILNSSAGCPHEHNIRPSDKLLLEHADMVIYVDDNFDNLTSLVMKDYKGKKIKISDISSISFTGKDGLTNWHFWLDLTNVKLLEKALAENIIHSFPEMKDAVEKNLSDALVDISQLEELKKSKLSNLDSMVLLTDSLEHFFKSLNIDYFQAFQMNSSTNSLKALKNLDDKLNSDAVKCLILDMEQNSELYSKYNKVIIQLDGENWKTPSNTPDDANKKLEPLFLDKYQEMINQLSRCRRIS